jgi:hypothetical protein
VSRLKRISRFWPAALALAVVSLVSGYILFLVGISRVVLQAHSCEPGNTKPWCAHQVHATWHTSAGGAMLLLGVLLLFVAILLVAIRFLAKGPPDTSRPDADRKRKVNS